jgi:hypothetical protein
VKSRRRLVFSSLARALFLCSTLLFLAAAAHAGEEPAAPERPATARLKDALANDPALSAETKRALLEALEALESKPPPAGDRGRQGTAEAAGAAAALQLPTETRFWDDLLEDLAFYGDFRLRLEGDFELDDRPERYRGRIRLRLGVNYQLSEDLLLGVRLTTGARGDPNSPHVTLGDGLDKFEVTIDRAFLSYRPAWLEGAALTAGKFAHPFYQNPVYGELVWDADVQPEGVAAGYKLSDLGWLESVELHAGEYVLLEQAGAEEALASVGQVFAVGSVAENTRLTVAAGYYLYTDATPGGADDLLLESEGNATEDRNGDGEPDRFRADFGIFNPIAAVTYSGLLWPITAAVEYILNTEAGGGENQGWAAGVAAGSAKERGDGWLYYQWQLVEQDAVFSPFAQDDFLFRTNHSSHAVGVNYQVLDGLGVHVWALFSQRDETSSGRTTDSDRDQWRVRIDFNVRF